MPRRPKDTPAKLARRMKRRWRVVLLRAKGEILGTVEAPDAEVGQGGCSGPVQFGRGPAQPHHGARASLTWRRLAALDGVIVRGPTAKTIPPGQGAGRC